MSVETNIISHSVTRVDRVTKEWMAMNLVSWRFISTRIRHERASRYPHPELKES